MTVLLDANVLVAVVVADHVHHVTAEEWFADHQEGFATCPITQGALLRLLLRQGASADQALQALDAVTAHAQHRFWPDDLPYGTAGLAGVVGHRQVTDAYLAALARERGCQLATFDRALAALHPGTAFLLST